MTAPVTQKESLRHRLRGRLHRLRQKSRGLLEISKIDSSSKVLEGPKHETNSQHVPSTAHSLHSIQIRNIPEKPSNTGNDAIQAENDQSTLHAAVHSKEVERNCFARPSTPRLDIDTVSNSSDMWSTAYREAVNSLGEDLDMAIFKGENVAQLFRQLEEIEKDGQESVFLRGVKYLHSLQVPLERFKLALDLATPLTSIEPTTATVFAVVRSVTAIAISIATADIEFAKQIGEMLGQISYIDDCDTLGQKTNKLDIHKALVQVYQKLLEFYNAAFDILTRKGAKMVMTMILETNRLPEIVQDFLRHADYLRKLVEKATLEIVEDIRAMLYDHEIARWLGSGKMSQQSKYHTDLQNLRADEACEFLLLDVKFISWYTASDSQGLVILGDMGCGKSVAMAFLVDELRKRNEHQLPQPRICYHYCRDDETGKADYIFSALILSLLEQFSGLKRAFFEWWKEAGAFGNFDPATDVRKLEAFLQKILETLDRPLFIVIDGLDECDRASQDSLLDSLKNLLQKTTRLKILLSSRPQDEILERLHGTAKINLSSDNRRDRVIVERTVERKLSNLPVDVKALIIETLSRLAQGSAIWTKMIVELIEVRRIRALEPMRTFLDRMSLPAQLSELYISLLSRCTADDPENRKLVTVALEVLAITRRPLSVTELAWAVALGTDQEGVTNVAALAKLVDHHRVMSLIQPFVAHVNFDDVKKRQVRLVHQSVKEFIISDMATNRHDLQDQAILRTAHQGLIDRRIGSLEAGLLDICIKYLLLNEIGRTDLFSEEQVAIEELPQEFDLFSNDEEPIVYDPYCTWETWEENMIRYEPTDRGFGELFVYASCHWPEHYGAIMTEHCPSLESIEDLCQAGSTRLQNWIKQYCRPQCTIQPRFLFDSKLYDPLSITSLYGSEAMLRDMLQSSKFDKRKFLPHPAMGAANQILQWGELSRLTMLFSSSSIGPQLRNVAFFRLVIEQWSSSKTNYQNWDVVFDLVDDVLDILVQERWGNELLCIAASNGCIPIIQRLMDSAQHKAELKTELQRVTQRETHDRSFGKPVHQSIGEAVLGNHVDVVEYLLRQQGIEAHLHYRNSRGENVLHLAARFCNPAMFRLLAPRFKEGIPQTDDQEETALMRIIQHSVSLDRYESEQILLVADGAPGDDCSVDEQ
ncbi:hypothetical protein WAI453_013344 [Rhynchosporium graminicola]|uniref:Related to vegetatible incompatibility protein HET-E-1 n=1 Tax=Rhynchosporium graminicola TaxID=2792576 RepID=A0A1E1KD32_9HELO|nr:related to vegetatible incompatibility protein HET-E-1 [Rhynchosporium commune]